MNRDNEKRELIRNRNVVYVGALLILFYEAIAMNTWGHRDVSELPAARHVPFVLQTISPPVGVTYTPELWDTLTAEFNSDPGTLAYRILEFDKVVVESIKACDEIQHFIDISNSTRARIGKAMQQCALKLKSKHPKKEVRLKRRQEGEHDLELLLEEAEASEFLLQDALARQDNYVRTEIIEHGQGLAREFFARLNTLIHRSNSRVPRAFTLEELVEFYCLSLLQPNVMRMVSDTDMEKRMLNEFLELSHLAGVENGIPVVPTDEIMYIMKQQSFVTNFIRAGSAVRTTTVQRGEATWDERMEERLQERLEEQLQAQANGLGAAQRRVYGDTAYQPTPLSDLIPEASQNMAKNRKAYEGMLHILWADDGILKADEFKRRTLRIRHHCDTLIASLEAQAAVKIDVDMPAIVVDVPVDDVPVDDVPVDDVPVDDVPVDDVPAVAQLFAQLSLQEATLPAKKKELCRVCKQNEARKRCCRVARYCSQDCSKADWPQHKLRCEKRIYRRKCPSLADLGPGGRFDGFSYDDAVAILTAEAEDAEAETAKGED